MMPGRTWKLRDMIQNDLPYDQFQGLPKEGCSFFMFLHILLFSVTQEPEVNAVSPAVLHSGSNSSPAIFNN
jgi:hypothetical protein